MLFERWHRVGLTLGLIAMCELSSFAEDRESIRFRPLDATSGIHFRYDAGSRGRHDLPEIMGGGVALIDMDNDGYLDIYFCNGGPIEKGKSDPPGALFRNLGNGKFQAVANAPPGPSYAMGTAVGDFDGDGRDDLLVTGWRGICLYKNAGNGRFDDVTIMAGVNCEGLWTTSAAFADLDGDGDLDLYLATYVDYDADDAPFTTAPDGKRDYPGPEDFSAGPDKLFRNNGNGTFTDVSKTSGIEKLSGRGLGVLIADLVGDQRPDIYVANDGMACHLWENQGNLRFEEVGERSGLAFDGTGTAIAGMGIAVGEIEGKSTLMVTNLYERTTIGFRSTGVKGIYEDQSQRLGLVGPTKRVTGFGIALQDFDSDGFLDLIQSNGHVLDRQRLGVAFAMKPTLLRGEGGRFVEVASPAIDEKMLGRGLAVGDLNRDGRVDVVVAPIDRAPLILINESSRSGMNIDLGRTHGAALRAIVKGRTIVRANVAGGSYLSTSSRVVHMGMGEASAIDRLEVDWPSGRKEVWINVEKQANLRLVEGSGRTR